MMTNRRIQKTPASGELRFGASNGRVLAEFADNCAPKPAYESRNERMCRSGSADRGLYSPHLDCISYRESVTATGDRGGEVADSCGSIAEKL